MSGRALLKQNNKEALMKFMLFHRWTEIGGMLQMAIAAIVRSPSATAVGVRQLHRNSGGGAMQESGQQSFSTKQLTTQGLKLLAGVGLSTVALANPAMQQAPQSTMYDNTASWVFSETRVVSKGSVDVMAEGEFTRDFILESKAAATRQDGSVVPAGTLKLILSAFTPAYDQHGRKKGAWYIWGKWILTDSSITHPGVSGRQRPGEISGPIRAELDFNPLVTKKNWTAGIRLPMTRIAPVAQAGSSQPARGEGALTMDDKREGTMTLNLKLWPTMQH